jgi:RNA recognition motif. (a.k.a. RRM, RBD, or RNP domain)
MPIVVGHLACTTTEQDLRQRFEPYGTVDTVSMAGKPLRAVQAPAAPRTKAPATGGAAQRARREAKPCAPCSYQVEPSALVQGLGIL